MKRADNFKINDEGYLQEARVELEGSAGVGDHRKGPEKNHAGAFVSKVYRKILKRLKRTN